MSTPFNMYGRINRRIARLCLLLLAALTVGAVMPSIHAQQSANQEDNNELKLLGNPITDILNIYEPLVGKRIVRDANLAGPNLTVIAPGPISKAEAIAMLESAMLLNGYTLIDVDDSTMKIIGPAKSPLGESIPLFMTPESLPQTEQVVSYFMLFRNISTKDAFDVFSQYVSTRQQGKITPVPNSNAIVITDNTPLIRRLINLQAVIDVPGSKVLTEFVPLTRARADNVAELMNKILEEEKQKRDAGRATVDVPVAPNPAGGPPGATGAMPSLAVSTSGTQVLADVRTNRILIVAPESRMGYLRKLVQDLDVAVELDPPLTWPLKFVSAGEVLPVLQSILAEGEDQDKAATPANGNNNSSSNQNDSSSGDSYGSSSSGGGGGGTRPDKLKSPTAETSPIAVSVGNIRIIADRSANKIIVIGPPESKSKAANVLAILDQKPKQIYLATVIGELTLGKGLDLGVQYPGSTKVSLNITGNNGNISTSSSASSASATAGNTLINSNGGVDIVPGTAEAINSAFQIASGVGLPILSGLSLYGVVGDSIDLYLKALQSTNSFRVISRPVIYTANNKKAVISSGQQVPVPQNSLTSSLGNSVQGASIATSIDYKDVVLKLEVIPLINSDNEVTLTIAQQNDNLRGNTTIGDNIVPIVGTQELTTTVTVPNRHTVVLGGLITEEETITRTGIPLLSSIPIIGYAFGQKSKTTTRRELIIMIQPFIISSPADEAEANYIETSMSGLNGQLYQDKIPVRRAEGVEAAALPVQTPPKGWRKAKNDLSPMGAD